MPSQGCADLRQKPSLSDVALTGIARTGPRGFASRLPHAFVSFHPGLGGDSRVGVCSRLGIPKDKTAVSLGLLARRNYCRTLHPSVFADTRHGGCPYLVGARRNLSDVPLGIGISFQ